VQILRSLLHDAHASEVQRVVADGNAPEIAALVPELLGAFAGLPAATAPDSATARFQLFESMTNALIAGGTQKTVLVLDDLHWADASLPLLGFVAREIRDAPILIPGRTGTSGRQHPLTKTLGELARSSRSPARLARPRRDGG
jgi:predicted ATPase